MITEQQSRILVCGSDVARRHEISSLLERIGFSSIDNLQSTADAEKALTENQYALTVCDTSERSIEAMQLAYNESKKSNRQSALLLVGDTQYSDMLTELCRITDSYCITRPYTVTDFCNAVLGALSGRLQKETAPCNDDGDGDVSSETQITEILHTLGIPAHIKGFTYIRCAIGMTLEDPDMINYVTKSLYPSVAKAYSTTTSRVERAIRHAIEVAWDRGDVDVLNRYFGYTISRQRGKPTNSEFIAMISDKLRLGVGV